MNTDGRTEHSCYSGTLLPSVFHVPGTVLGPEITEMHMAGSVHPLSDLVLADVHGFFVSLEKPAKLSELMYLPSKQRPEGHLPGSVSRACNF